MAVENVISSEDARGKIVLVAQEITLAKILAGNNKTLRDRGIKRLGKWLKARSSGSCEFTDDDFMRIWKGLFYCMWMSDKPLVQEDQAERISRLILCFKKIDQAILFIQGFYRTMVIEWHSIDQFRYDKFMMLVRRFLRQTFEFCRISKWNADVIQEVCNGFSATILSTSTGLTNSQPVSLVMHFCDIYLQELAKVSRGKLPVEMLTAFLQPFICYLAEQENAKLRCKVQSDVFYYLLKQSDAGIEFEGKWRAWKAAGFPGDSLNAMEKVEDDDSEMAVSEESDDEIIEDDRLDPRAGRVDVELPQLKFDVQGIVDTLIQQSEKCARKKNRCVLQSLAEKFKKLSEETYPLAALDFRMISKPKIEKFRLRKHVKKAAIQLKKFENNEGKRKRRKRKRHVQKKLDQEDTNKNDTTNCSDKMVIQAAGENKETITSVTQATEVSGDLIVTDEHPQKETKDVRVTENNSEVVQDRKEIEEPHTKASVPVPGMKRKCGLILSELENMDVGLQNSKIQRNKLPKALKVAKDKKIEMSKKKIAERMQRDSLSNLSSKLSIPGSRKSGGGDWNVSDVADTKLKSVGVKVVTPSSGKKVNIALNRNSAQDVREYHMSVIRSPAIPFDASKKPVQGVLKQCPVVSRINPFYKLNKNKKMYF